MSYAIRMPSMRQYEKNPYAGLPLAFSLDLNGRHIWSGPGRLFFCMEVDNSLDTAGFGLAPGFRNNNGIAWTIAYDETAPSCLKSCPALPISSCISVQTNSGGGRTWHQLQPWVRHHGRHPLAGRGTPGLWQKAIRTGFWAPLPGTGRGVSPLFL
jgi:hypothetical protein